MRSVLGIDAAWTERNASGVALVIESEGRWRLARASHSCSAFVSTLGGEPEAGIDVGALIESCVGLTGQRPDLVAIDMPLSNQPIVSRRASDDAVSRTYGSRHCSTHSPSAVRPGKISDKLTEAFRHEQYPLITRSPVRSGLIEVYPHPALVELTDASRRLPYKIARVRNYWPKIPMAERREALIVVWRQISEALEAEISGVVRQLEIPSANAPLADLKRFEDALDAVVCAWVGVKVLAGEAIPYGDAQSAIWIPRPRSSIAGQSGNPSSP